MRVFPRRFRAYQHLLVALGAALEGRSLGCGALAHASGGESCVIDEHILWLVIWNKSGNMIPGS